MSNIKIDFNLYCKKLYKKNDRISNETMAKLLFFVYDEYISIYKEDLKEEDLEKCPDDLMTIEDHKIVIKDCNYDENKKNIKSKLNCNSVDAKIVSNVWNICKSLTELDLTARLEKHSIYIDCCKGNNEEDNKVTPRKLFVYIDEQNKIKHDTMMKAMKAMEAMEAMEE